MRSERFEIEVVDENGHQHTLHGMRRISSYPTLSDGTLRQPGRAELFTADGEPVNHETDGSYTAIQSSKRFFPA